MRVACATMARSAAMQHRPDAVQQQPRPPSRLPAAPGFLTARRPPVTRVASAGRPPGPEYAALEAAIGAINRVLALRGGRAKGAAGGAQDGANGGEQAAARVDPGKLVTFRAKSSASREVTVGRRETRRATPLRPPCPQSPAAAEQQPS